MFFPIISMCGRLDGSMLVFYFTCSFRLSEMIDSHRYLHQRVILKLFYALQFCFLNLFLCYLVQTGCQVASKVKVGVIRLKRFWSSRLNILRICIHDAFH